MYGKTYTREAINHINADPKDPTLPAAYHELIIETGFYVYFMICYYTELGSSEVDPDTIIELDLIKKSAITKDEFAEMK